MKNYKIQNKIIKLFFNVDVDKDENCQEFGFLLLQECCCLEYKNIYLPNVTTLSRLSVPTNVRVDFCMNEPEAEAHGK